MRRVLKVIFWCLLVLILACVIAGFAIAKWVDPNHYKSQIERAVYQ